MDTKAIIAFLADWIFLPILIAVIIAFLNRKALSKPQRWIFLLTTVALVFQLASYFLWRNQINNLPLLHVYTPIELVLIVIFFRSLSKDNAFRMILNFMALLFVVSCAVNVLYFQSVFEMNGVMRGLESLIVISLSIWFWIKIMRELKIERLLNSPLFWFNTGFLVYFSVNFILFLFSSDLNKLAIEQTIQPWLVHSFFMTIYYLLFAIGLWKKQLQ